MRTFKKLSIAVTFVLFLLSILPCKSQETAEKGAKFTTLVWGDEFNYSGLPDSSKWNYETGLLRDYEKQFYTYKRRENIRVENGVLIITARKEKYRNDNFSKFKNKPLPQEYLGYSRDSIPAWVKNRFDSTAEYTSGSLITLGKVSWTGGKISVRAKLPYGKGVWPVIWMLGVNKQKIMWPYCGEIDIMEHVGRLPQMVQANVHYADSKSKQKYDSPKRISVDDLSENYHIYSIIWSATEIRFFIDEHQYHAFSFDQIPKDIDNPFNKPFYLLINLVLGGTFGGPIDDSFLPQELQVDYVRVYQ